MAATYLGWGARRLVTLGRPSGPPDVDVVHAAHLADGEQYHRADTRSNFVKEQLGHATITTTVDTYGHALPNANRGAGEQLA